MLEICDAQPSLLLSAVLDLRLLFRKPYYMVGPYILSLLDAGIALQGLITQVTSLIYLNQQIAVPNASCAQLRHTDSPELWIMIPCMWFRHTYVGQVVLIIWPG